MFPSETETLRSVLLVRIAQDTRPLPPRVERIEIGNYTVWIKRRERPGLRMRLQKGSPARAFDTERRALRDLEGSGAPVPVLLADTATAFAISDGGTRITVLAKQSPETIPSLLESAGRALGRLHGMGFAHGRPAPKDMCWQDGIVTLIDWERYDPLRNTPAGQARDLVIFTYSVLSQMPGAAHHLDAMLAAYRGTAPAQVWPLARQLAHRLRWLAVLSRLAPRRREFRAFAPALAALAALPPRGTQPAQEPSGAR